MGERLTPGGNSIGGGGPQGWEGAQGGGGAQGGDPQAILGVSTHGGTGGLQDRVTRGTKGRKP